MLPPFDWQVEYHCTLGSMLESHERVQKITDERCTLKTFFGGCVSLRNMLPVPFQASIIKLFNHPRRNLSAKV